jgi:hypothetical protein
MFRRILSTLLIVGYVASQVAALPHEHASQPAGHGARPHVHGDWLAGLVSDVPSDRHHRNGGHHHAHSHSHPHTKTTPTPAPAAPLEPAHDHDCVYLPQPTTGLNEARPADDSGQFGDCIASLDEVAASADSLILDSARRCLSPHWLKGHCALYLTLRTLRI